MAKVKSISDLTAYKNAALAGDSKHIVDSSITRLYVGMATCGVAAGAADVMAALQEEIDKNGVKNTIVIPTGCIGMCYAEPMVEIRHPDGKTVFASGINADDARKVVTDYLMQKQAGEFIKPNVGYGKQVRVALRNCGNINPENICDYVAVGGYEALAKCLTSMSREGVIEEMKKSGLRGRGGAGFPTGVKWEFGFKNNSPSGKKYILCNADEGDPGAFMDRAILEGDPHSVLEAMAIAGYAVGADEGVIYTRAEYPLAVERLNIAIGQAVEKGLLGEGIMGTDFNFTISISMGAGAFVCGEETALINSLQGQRGEPRLRPPFPAQKGLWYEPTVNNNVETYAMVPAIIAKGADWFRTIGTERTPGTKVFALAGKINNVGLIEVPIGTTLKEIVYEVGGGLPGGKALKSIQTGGPSGGCIPVELQDTPVDFETLNAIGSMMGSGGMVVLDEDDCMVNIAKFYLDFTVEESCGKCTPCRIGNTRLYEILDKITMGHGTEQDLVELRQLGEVIKDTSLCGLGNSAPNPVLSTLNYFMDEYKAHVIDKKCPAGACTDLLTYKVVPAKCIGCTLCARVCPVNCIHTVDEIVGNNKKLHVIDQNECIKCGACVPKCPTKAIVVE